MGKYHYLLCLLVPILCGCVKDTSLDAGLERKVVVEFVLTDDGVQNLYLSLTGEPGEKGTPSVREAEIELIDITRSKELNRDIVFDRFVRVSDDRWTLDYAGVPGHEYRLEVKIDEYDPVFAEQKMPDKFEMNRAGIGHVSPSKKYSYVGYGAFYLADYVPDCLMIQGTKRDKETGESVQIEELCTDYPGVVEMNATGRFYDGNPKWRTGTGFHFTETGWENANYVYHDGPVAGEKGVWTYMYPNLIGRELYEGFLFINRVDENHAGLDRLYIFSAGYDYSTGEEDLSARGFCVGGSFDFKQDKYDEYLVFSSLSPDYGRFLKEAYQLKKVHEGGDLSSIYLRDNIHSNIQGGLGIFGAKVSDIQVFYGYPVNPEGDKPDYDYKY